MVPAQGILEACQLYGTRNSGIFDNGDGERCVWNGHSHLWGGILRIHIIQPEGHLPHLPRF